MVLLALFASALATEGYLRQPDLHGDEIVFVSEGDLWLVPAAGGLAHRITAYGATSGRRTSRPTAA